ncbi:MAG: hypothetical protein ACEQSB_01830 [Undibacterium sp.]
MTFTTQSLFDQIRPLPPVGLSQRILLAIEADRIHQAKSRARLAAWSAGSWFIVFLVSIASVGKNIAASEFWQLASLLFTDLSLILAHAEDFFISLAETFPAGSAVVILAPLFLYAVSLVLRSKYLSLTAEHSQLRFQIGH